MKREAEVAAVLAKYRTTSSNYGEPELPLSDHLPMAVLALAEMGATPKRLESWAASYAAQNTLRDAGFNEREQRERWRQRIAEQGRDAVLAGALPGLVEGVGAAAFHSAIRAAYAVQREDDDELAAALESWQREFLELPAPRNVQFVSAKEALTKLGTCGLHGNERGLIATCMRAAAEQPGFAAVARLVPHAKELDALAHAAAVAFAETSGFIVLHMMTGSYAMRTLIRYVPDPGAAMPAFWRAYVAAGIISNGAAAFAPHDVSELRDAAPRGWETLLNDAVKHEDEHVIKATYTAWRLDEALRDPIFRIAAHRYIEQATYR